MVQLSVPALFGGGAKQKQQTPFASGQNPHQGTHQTEMYVCTKINVCKSPHRGAESYPAVCGLHCGHGHETLQGGAANKHDKHVCLNIAEAPLSSTAHTN